jgi:hypothetical protein
MDHFPLVGYLALVPFILCVVGAAISWFFAAYYMIKTLNRFHPQRQWGKFLAFSLFLSWFFTEEGNLYRVKLLKAVGLFLLFSALGMGIGFGAKALTSGLAS